MFEIIFILRSQKRYDDNDDDDDGADSYDDETTANEDMMIKQPIMIKMMSDNDNMII